MASSRDAMASQGTSTQGVQPLVHELAARDVVFVTGATGFLGAEIVRQLARRRVEIVALVRGGAERVVVPGVELQIAAGDLTDAASVVSGLERAAEMARARAGRLYVIHSGALISYRTRDRASAVAINVEGTRVLLEASRKIGVSRFVFISSVVAVGEARGVPQVDESVRFNLGHLGVHYTDTKRAAEELVLARSGELDVVVVNPGAIFGVVEGKSNTVRFIRRMAQGKVPIAAPPGTISVVGVEDTAAGTIAALERGRRGERYILVESFVSTRELFDRIAVEVGSRSVSFTVPSRVLTLVVPLVQVVDAVIPLDFTPPQALKMLGRELRLDGSKARRELSWSPRPFSEVLRATIQGLRERGLLDAGD